MFRTERHPCGHCGAPMTPVAVDGLGATPPNIDVCLVCGAAFLEYFDGEPIALAKALAIHPEYDLAGVQGPIATTCPTCGPEALQRRSYLGGPSLTRCGECMATLATRHDVRLLTRFRPVDERERSSLGWFGRMLRTLFRR